LCATLGVLASRPGGERRLKARDERLFDREDASAPRSSWRLDRDLLAHLATDQGASQGRVRRDAADARDLHVHVLALLVDNRYARSDPDPARCICLTYNGRAVEPVAKDLDPSLEHSLFVLRRVILEVLGEIAIAPRPRN